MSQIIVDVTREPYIAGRSGNSDVSAIIQKALNNPGSTGGGVVYLSEGTYLIRAGSSYALHLSDKNLVLLVGETVVPKT